MRLELKLVSVLLVAVACFACVLAVAAAESQTNQVSEQFLLKDRLGNITQVPTNEVPSSLHPPTSTGLGQQIPVPAKGTTQSENVRKRLIESKTGREWFPPTPPVIMPYLANVDEYGNTAIQPGPVFPTEPLTQVAQAGKYALSELGLRYSFIRA
jgi:hypothetical protein